MASTAPQPKTATTQSAGHARAVRSGIAEVAASLQDLLGQRLTAVIAGVADARAVGDWARGQRTPHPKAADRLRHAYQVAALLAEDESPETVRAWFVGMNPDLDDHPPALVIAEEPTRVMQAARAFLAHG
jgi:hypothetical protein